MEIKFRKQIQLLFDKVVYDNLKLTILILWWRWCQLHTDCKRDGWPEDWKAGKQNPDGHHHHGQFDDDDDDDGHHHQGQFDDDDGYDDDDDDVHHHGQFDEIGQVSSFWNIFHFVSLSCCTLSQGMGPVLTIIIRAKLPPFTLDTKLTEPIAERPLRDAQEVWLCQRSQSRSPGEDVFWREIRRILRRPYQGPHLLAGCH